DVNLRCLEFSRKALRNSTDAKALAAQIVISQDVLLTDSLRAKLIKAYLESNAKPEVVLLWIDSLAEQELSGDELRAYMELVEGLAQTGRGVVNLYGGYFSVAAARFGSLKGKLVG